ncbi:MAG TPA: hypothetical protein DCY27_10375 [Desulfobacterales bacterium]|nr:hypothetical protein [Desulfobacterales bacterium]
MPGATLGKLQNSDCELKSDKQLFVFTGDSARKLIAAFTQGTAITIRDCFRGDEFTVPFKGFNAAYERALMIKAQPLRRNPHANANRKMTPRANPKFTPLPA